MIVLTLQTAYGRQDDVLFTIDGEETMASEFKRMLFKNETDSGLDKEQFDQYLSAFVDYKLKVKEAYTLGLDQSPEFKAEFEDFKQAFTDGYLKEVNASEDLVREAYERMQWEIDADHILVETGPGAAFSDSLSAFTKISELYSRATSGDFDKLLDSVHELESIRGERLGYFTVFSMVYPFENAAYKTAVGGVSPPFRTEFGYHIVKVNDKRTARGSVDILHILIRSNPDDPENDKSVEKIQSVYEQLEKGESFESLARKYSEDQASAAKGGVLEGLESVNLKLEPFNEIVFSLKEGEISKPFHSTLGWHLVKILRKHPIGSLEEERSALKKKIEQDDRSHSLPPSFYSNLMQTYGVTENKTAVKSVFRWLEKNNTTKALGSSNNRFLQDVLFIIGDKKLRGMDFSNYIYALQSGSIPDAPKNFLSESYTQFVRAEVLQYHKDHLESVDSTYAALVREYKEGLLLFDLMQQKVWLPSEYDSLGIRKYREMHADTYSEHNRVVFKTVVCPDANALKIVLQLWKEEMPEVEMTKRLREQIDWNPVFNEKTVVVDNLTDCRIGDVKVQELDDKTFQISRVERCLSYEAIKSEIESEMVADYQKYLEATWINELKKRHEVKLMEETVQKIKKELSK